MKFKKLGALLVSAALCAGMAAPAFAFEGEAAPVEQPVLPEVVEEDVVTVTDEISGALTPEGNLTLVDDYHTDYSDGSGQQFITLVSKSGATFYLVIDRNAKGQQTVHFMNLVDEADLLALMEEDAADAYTAEKEAAAQAEQDRLKAEEEAKKAAEEAAASGTEQPKENKITMYAATFLGMIALVALAAGGGFYAFMKQKQKKQAEKEALDPDAGYTEDKGDFEIPVEDEPEENDGGQKQTIAFASVYALNPDIFVLDEPSSNLDPEAIQELRRLLLLIKAQGKTIVVSEHRLYFLNGIADRIVLMEHGKLKQSWSASDFALFNAEQIKALGLRSYTPTRLELPDTMPSRNEPPAVEVKDLAIGYEKGKPVAQHLNFRVYPGEIVGVVGKNGCGKSTLARTLCGLQKELRGEVLYKNSMVPSKRRIRKAYLVMQDPDYQLFTDSVYQELLLALSDQKDKDEKRIDDILDELNLTTYKERHPMSLSGGQKQRTAIGVAALRDAEVLIFDEPTSGLDYKNMESVAEILSALSKRGKAILVISHDNELLMKICSRVIRVDERTSS